MMELGNSIELVSRRLKIWETLGGQDAPDSGRDAGAP
jgi:hypothetical protein